MMEKSYTRHSYTIDIEKYKKALGIKSGERIIKIQLVPEETVMIVTEQKFYPKGEIKIGEEEIL